jgi:tetratricopeptide (TPR) repeat protein
VKALFRQGKCYLALDKWEAAKESFRKVLELDDGNMEARRGLQSVRVKMQQQKEKEKKLYAGKKLFDGKDRPQKKTPAACCAPGAEDACCPPPPPEADAPPPAEQ